MGLSGRASQPVPCHGDPVEQTVEELIGAKGVEPEVRARALIIREVVAKPAWYHAVGKNDDGGITLFHRLPDRLLKRIANRGNVAFVSATVTVSNSFSDFKRSMGIENASRLSGVVEPTKHGDIVVETPSILAQQK